MSEKENQERRAGDVSRRDAEAQGCGNAAAMREALESILSILKGFDFESQNAPTPDDLNCVHSAIGIANAALASPPRNCDVGDAADWEKRFGEECDKGHTCSDCPVRHAKTRMAIELDKGARCEFIWAQMPYEAKEGGNNVV